MSNYTIGTPIYDDTLAGLLQMGDKNLADFIAKDTNPLSQFITALPWYPASNGTQHKWLVETDMPGAAFRTVNNGVTNAAGKEKLVTADMKYLDATVVRDVMLRRGSSLGDYLEREAVKSVIAAINKAENSFILGTAYDAAGPDGLADFTIASSLQTDAGGAASTHTVYMGIMGEDAIAGIVGNDGAFTVGEPFQTQVADAGGDLYTADVVNVGGYLCLQVAGSYQLGKIINLDGTAGHTLTDSLLLELYLSFPSDKQGMINFIMLAPESMKELVDSRTATNPTGAPAPIPAEWAGAGRGGIQMIVSSAL